MTDRDAAPKTGFTFFKILLDNLYVTVTKNVWQTAKILFNTRTTNKTTLSYMTKRVQSIEFAQVYTFYL